MINDVSLVSLIKKANNVFRDSKDGGIMNRLDSIIKILMIKIFDEEYKTTSEFKILPGEKAEQVYNRMSNLYDQLVTSSEFSYLIPENMKNLPDDKEAIYNIVSIWQSYTFSENFEDINGIAFQEVLKSTFDKSENQQYFTPIEIGKFMSEIASVILSKGNKSSIKILDPAVGTGELLIQFSRAFQKHTNISYVGADIDERMAWIASVNTFLKFKDKAQIFHESFPGGALNKLKSHLNENAYDLIITNPPFGSDLNSEDIVNQYKLSKYSKRRSVLFIERSVELLNEEGYLVIILDDTILNSEKNELIRRYLRKHLDLIALFSLPDSAFKPYASVKTSILVFRKGQSLNNKGSLYVEIENTGRKPSGEEDFIFDEQGRMKLNSDFKDAVDLFIKFEKGNKFDFDEKLNSIIVKKEDLNIEHDVEKTESVLDVRMDMLTYHPVVKEARLAISNSNFPLIKLLEVMEEKKDQVLPKKFPDDIFYYVGLANIEKNTGNYHSEQVFGAQIKSSTKLFSKGDIIYSKMRPELKKVFVAKEDGICSGECSVFKVNINIDNEYIAWLLRSDIIYGQIMGKVTGSGRPRVNSKSLMNCLIPLPDLNEQRKVAEKLNGLRNDYLNKKEKLKLEKEKLEKSFSDGIDINISI